MKDKISVIVPVYKVENYLHRCVDSIIKQTYENIEIILINDGSPDNSGKICDEYALKDSRVTVIHKKNEGSSCARNAGLDVATGEYISFVDSDDYLNISMLKTMMNYIKEHNLEVLEIEPLFSDKNIIFDDVFKIEDPITATERTIKDVKFAVWRRIFKRTLVDDMRFIPGIIHQDVFYTMDMLKRITKHGHLNSAFYHYNSDSVSIIRSKYSLPKITAAIRATQYIIANVADCPELKEVTSNYVTYCFTDHFFLLSRNTFIDPDKNFRKILKKHIKAHISSRNANFRSLLVILTPTKVMEHISSGYQSLKTR